MIYNKLNDDSSTAAGMNYISTVIRSIDYISNKNSRQENIVRWRSELSFEPMPRAPVPVVRRPSRKQTKCASCGGAFNARGYKNHYKACLRLHERRLHLDDGRDDMDVELSEQGMPHACLHRRHPKPGTFNP